MYINKSPKQRKKHIFFAHLQYPVLFTFIYITYLLRFFGISICAELLQQK